MVECLGGSDAPVVAATDYMKALPDGIRDWIDARYVVLGTDGFGRSDYRRHLRRFFEVDRAHVVVAALSALAADGAIEPSVVDGRDRQVRDRPRRPRPRLRLWPKHAKSRSPTSATSTRSP